MAPRSAQERIFTDRRRGVSHHVVLPWSRTLEVCWSNIRHRLGRSALTFVCIAVVVAFFMSSMTYQRAIAELVEREDIHTQAVLEKAGVFRHDDVSRQRQKHQEIWLMTLSAFLCLVGITNTILMSVTERVREIGTLKCLGALDRFIVRLFLVENLFLGVLGSLSGAAVGFLLSVLQIGLAFEFRLLSLGACWRALSAGAPIGIGAGTLLTVLAAVYPTYVAAKMKPVDAMRVEV